MSSASREPLADNQSLDDWGYTVGRPAPAARSAGERPALPRGRLLTADIPGRNRDDRKPARYCCLPVQRMLMSEAVLISENGYLS